MFRPSLVFARSVCVNSSSLCSSSCRSLSASFVTARPFATAAEDPTQTDKKKKTGLYTRLTDRLEARTKRKSDAMTKQVFVDNMNRYRTSQKYNYTLNDYYDDLADILKKAKVDTLKFKITRKFAKLVKGEEQDILITRTQTDVKIMKALTDTQRKKITTMYMEPALKKQLCSDLKITIQQLNEFLFRFYNARKSWDFKHNYEKAGLSLPDSNEAMSETMMKYRRFFKSHPLDKTFNKVMRDIQYGVHKSAPGKRNARANYRRYAPSYEFKQS
eukprot:TRINITY_DN11673_c0_g1_i1.p1 TRINITY_DN11673_c0_g1~~TRINITY_DN11673_c0_g1_i1.p1  ORF type:complete len:273 (+),score=50.06 TRINITY_DN11673_c0_g1_i1:63-881(+)